MAVKNSALLPTTYVYDIESLGLDNTALANFLVQLYQSINNMAVVINMKDTGMYDTREFINSQVLFSVPGSNANSTPPREFRPIYRKVIDFGALPNAGIKSVPHLIPITANYKFTRIYATASDPIALSYIPIPYVSSIAVAQNLELYVDGVNVNIATGFNYSAYTTCFVVLEYVKIS